MEPSGPAAIPGLLKQALADQLAGRLDEAECIYRRILAMDDRHADSLHLVGMIEFQRGNNTAAAALIRNAIAINHQEAHYHSNLGTVLQAEGELQEAAACYERALAFKQNWAEVHSNLGNNLQAQGKLAQAADCQERALALKPELAEAHSNLGNVRQAQHRFEEAVACYQRALALKPDYSTAHNNLVNALVALDRIDEAVDHYRSALALRPDYADAHNNLGNIFKEQGKFDAAMEHYGRAVAIRPDYARAHFNRTEVKRFHPGDADLEALEALAERENWTPDDATHIHFGLAKALDDIGDYARGFEHLRKGNALKRGQVDYNEAEALQCFERIRTVFDEDLLARLGAQGDPSPAPVFVLGMPRSGSTLIEQVLAGHPQFHAAGELTLLEKMEAGALSPAGGSRLSFPECVAELDADALRRLGRFYIESLPPAAEGALRVIDKLPGNFFRIGLIRLILPNARIIHCMRDPADTCFSCYSKLFASGLHYCYDLAELGRFYSAYRELMAHWRRVLPPGGMLDVSYEDVVDDLEGQARRMVEYCGLPWDSRCVEFHRNSRPVKTASAVQVRQPLYRSSLQRWRHYEAGLAPLLSELGKVAQGGKDAK